MGESPKEGERLDRGKTLEEKVWEGEWDERGLDRRGKLRKSSLESKKRRGRGRGSKRRRRIY